MAEVLYVCDPAKNTACNKTMCKHNPRSMGPCEHTQNPAYAREGAEPVVPVLLEVLDQ